MNKNELKKLWKKEEERVFKGWDFSYLERSTINEELPWDYKEIVLEHLKETDVMLDMGTGGGEFLLTLQHPFKQTHVTEAYPPNVDLCKKKLGALGIDVNQVYEDDLLPFEDESMDIVINRHESYDIKEVYRILKLGGVFITQQVGGSNNVDFSNRLCPLSKRLVDDNNSLEVQTRDFINTGLKVISEDECFPTLKFLDTGGLVYFAKIIEWEFIDFSVDSCFEQLLEINKEIEEKGFVASQEHRFIIVARK